MPVAIVGNNIFCNQTSDSLTDLSIGGTWSSSNNAIAVISPTTGKITGVSGGTVRITYTLPTGCFVTRNVTIHPLPAPPINYNWLTETFSTNNYYVGYQWYQSGVAVPGANSWNFAVFDNDSYYVIVTDTFGCTGTSAVFNMNAVGIQQPGMHNAVKIHPNPTTGYIKIESPVDVKAVITSMEGRAVLEQDSAKEMNISHLPAGMYMIMLYDESGRRLATEKLIKE